MQSIVLQTLFVVSSLLCVIHFNSQVKEKSTSLRAHSFASHPGKITFHEEWNHSDRIKDAASVPDSIKFILYDAKGFETSDAAQATRRVPILEISTRSADAHGKPVEPRLASVIEITSYGTEHRFLRQTTARVPPKR